MRVVHKVISCELVVDEFTKRALIETLALYNSMCSYSLRYALENAITNRITLSQHIYNACRRKFPKLPSKYVVLCFGLVCGAIKAARTRGREPKEFTKPTAELDKDIFRLRSDSGLWYVSIGTTEGRLLISLKIGEYQKRELSHPQNTRIQHAKLRYDRKHNRFWLNIVVEREVPEVEPTGRVVGVDLGIQNLATCSNRLRFSGKQAQHMRRRFINLRRALQKKGTKGAKRTLKRLSGREKRITSSINHLIARRIVDSLNSGDTLVMEKLTGIRERARVRKHQRYIHHRWAFAQLQAYIRYKALEKGICVALVNPRHTSKCCSRCGGIGKRDRHRFVCPQCGYKNSADFNAAYNIARVYAFEQCSTGEMPLSDGAQLHAPEASTPVCVKHL